MKKNFLKKLAFTMAFATAFTALSPAAGVFAAKAPSLTVGKTLTLLLGTDRESHDINVNNKVKGSTYKWTTSNKAVATVNAKNGIVEGVKTGTAKVTLKITLPTKKTQTLTTTVNVKDNIKAVKINNAPEAAVKVGAEYDFNRTIVSTFGGNTKAHKGAITRWEIVSENKDKATIDDAGVFVATEAGEYEIVAKSFQSKAKYADYLAGKDTATAVSETVKFTVVNAIVSAKQNNLSSVDVTFGGTITDELKDKIEVHSVIGGTKVKQTIKEVKLDDAKKVATVVLWAPFIAKTEYVVSAPEAGDATFVAATQNVEDVANIVVTTKEAVVNKSTSIDYKLVNADGVDITTDALKARVTFETNSDKAYLSGSSITMLTVGEVANVTIKFHTYEYDAEGKEIVKVQATVPVVCVEVPSIVTGSISSYTVVNNNDPKFDKPVQRVALGDSGYRLFVEATKNNAAKDKVNSKDDYLFTFTSSNENVLIASPTGVLHPVAQGAVQVLVKYDNVVIGSVTVTVVAKRTAVSVELSGKSLNLSSKINESKTITVTVKDQLDAAMVGAEVKVEKLHGDINEPLLLVDNRTTDSDGKATLTFNGNAKTVGTYNYKVTVGNIVNTFNVTVSAPTGNVTRQRLDLSTNKVDMAISSGSTSRVVTFDLYDVAANNVDNENVTSNAKYSFEIINKKGEAVVTTSASFDLVTTNGSVWTKKETGRYTVRAWENKGLKDANGNSIEKLVDVKYFEVDDTQKAPTLAKVNGRYTNLGDVLAATKSLFEIKLGDKVFEAQVEGDIEYTGSVTAGSVHVSSIVVKEDINGSTLSHKVVINKLITFQ